MTVGEFKRLMAEHDVIVDFHRAENSEEIHDIDVWTCEFFDSAIEDERG